MSSCTAEHFPAHFLHSWMCFSYLPFHFSVLLHVQRLETRLTLHVIPQSCSLWWIAALQVSIGLCSYHLEIRENNVCLESRKRHWITCNNRACLEKQPAVMWNKGTLLFNVIQHAKTVLSYTLKHQFESRRCICEDVTSGKRHIWNDEYANVNQTISTLALWKTDEGIMITHEPH